MDLVFVLDSSGSVTQVNFDKVLDFVVGIIQRLPISSGGVRVGLVRFADDASSIFYLDDYFDRTLLEEAILETDYIQGGTNIAAGLREMTNNQYRTSNGDRAGIQNVALVVTDGQSTIDPELTLPDAKTARDAGIRIYSLGVTADVDEAEVQGISSQPQQEGVNWFHIEDFDELDEVLDEITRLACSPIAGPPGRKQVFS